MLRMSMCKSFRNLSINFQSKIDISTFQPLLGWEGVPFENGIALTRKNVGENEWDAFAESWIP